MRLKGGSGKGWNIPLAFSLSDTIELLLYILMNLGGRGVSKWRGTPWFFSWLCDLGKSQKLSDLL